MNSLKIVMASLHPIALACLLQRPYCRHFRFRADKILAQCMNLGHVSRPLPLMLQILRTLF